MRVRSEVDECLARGHVERHGLVVADDAPEAVLTSAHQGCPDPHVYARAIFQDARDVVEERAVAEVAVSVELRVAHLVARSLPVAVEPSVQLLADGIGTPRGQRSENWKGEHRR